MWRPWPNIPITMVKLKKIFEREYKEALGMGDSVNRAVYWAIDYIETCVKDVRTRFDYDAFRKAYAEYFAIYEAEKPLIEIEKEWDRIEGLRKKSVMDYYPVGTIVSLTTPKGKFKVKVVEQNFCKGCFFSKITGRAQGGYFIYGCSYDNVNKNAYCSAEMRDDRRKVAYIPVK